MSRLPGAVLRADRYREHGEAGFLKKFSHYSADFKLSVLRRMQQEELSCRQVTALFDLRGGHGVVTAWERQYHEGGLDALRPKSRGRPKTMTAHQPPQCLPPPTGDTRTLEQLRQENEYLRAEVAYLKKFRALLQAKEHAARKRRGYAFVRDHAAVFPVRRMCAVLEVHLSGYYAWRRSPHSARALEDRRLVGLIRQSWQDSGHVYGYRKVTHDLRDLGEHCGRHRVARLMRESHLRSQTGYKRRPGNRGGRPSLVAENLLQQRFDVAASDQAWVTDITYIRTHEGWLYLAVVLDLFARTVVGWSMSSRIDSELMAGAKRLAGGRLASPSEGGGHHP